MAGAQLEHGNSGIGGPFFEVLTAEDLAERWRVPATWVREQCRSRCTDPIPHNAIGQVCPLQLGQSRIDTVVDSSAVWQEAIRFTLS